MQLRDFLSSIKTSQPLLPGTHVCNFVELSTTLAQKELKPTPCDVFKEDLVYVFYGRPAFRPKSCHSGAHYYHAYPTCMIFDLQQLKISPKRIYPFDTGAYDSRYKSIMTPGLLRDGFLLAPEVTSAAQVIAHYFGTNEAYFQGSVCVNAKDSDPVYVEALANLYQSYGKSVDSSYDDRCFTIELQYDAGLATLAPVLRHIITPTQCLKKQEIQEFVAGGGTVAGYPSYLGTASESHALISAECERYLKKINALN